MINYKELRNRYRNYRKYLKSINKPNIDFRLFWLDKARRYTNKSIDYIIFSESTMKECKSMIYLNDIHKPNRIWNQVSTYKKYKESLK